MIRPMTRKNQSAGWRRALSFLVIFTLLLAFLPGLPETAEADSVPAPDAPVTVSNILALAKAYDPDAYHILSTMNSKGEDIHA